LGHSTPEEPQLVTPQGGRRYELGHVAGQLAHVVTALIIN